MLSRSYTSSVLGRDVDVVQRHDTRQRGNTADEIADLVITAGQANLDRLLGVKVLAESLACGMKQLSCRPAARPVCEISTIRLGISVSPGSCRSIVPNDCSICASCDL